jgi:redox-sensitive bicupin YhaK (pirin superfamily)
MAIKVVWRKDQLVKISHNGALRERKILGYPLEETPLNAYSNIFYWSHVVSDYGCTITDKPIVGFEIFTYVLKGTYETYHRDTDTWNLLREGDIEIIQAGKGTRYSEKIHSEAEILKIWFDPGFDMHQRINPLQTSYKKVSLHQKSISNRETTVINDKNNSGKFYARDVSIKI